MRFDTQPAAVTPVELLAIESQVAWHAADFRGADPRRVASSKRLDRI